MENITVEGNEFYLEELKVPKERVGVFIGKNGETKKELAETMGCEIDIDSKEGIVTIKSPDSINLMIAKDVIKAIARGFNPEFAKLLINDEYSFQMINLNDYNAHKNHQERLKGRVIGRNGKSRSMIEEYTECHISIYGKTIGIIGKGENVRIAFKAVESLLEGSPHAYVYKWLEKQRTELETSEIPF